MLLLIGALSLIPAALFTLTGFTRIIIVLGFIRTGLGTPTAPPNQVLVGIALFLTIFVMAPTFNQIKKDAFDPLPDGQDHPGVGAQARRGADARVHVRPDAHEGHRAVRRHGEARASPRRARTSRRYVLIPAFIISELKTAFQIGFLIFLPFLIIDLVVARR